MARTKFTARHAARPRYAKTKERIGDRPAHPATNGVFQDGPFSGVRSRHRGVGAAGPSQRNERQANMVADTDDDEEEEKEEEEEDAVIPKEPQADKAIPTVEQEEVLPQLQVVKNFLNGEGMAVKFLQFPPASALVFSDFVPTRATKNHFPRRLFLGSDGKIHVWAYLYTFRTKSSEVTIIENSADGDSTESEKIIQGTDWQHLTMMYPFRILQRRSTNHARALLNVLVQYYFLEGGEIARVWTGNAMQPMKNLKYVINIVTKAYAKYPGGVAAVPDTYGPDDIPTRAARGNPNLTVPGGAVPRGSSVSTAGPMYEDLMKDMEAVSVTPRPEEPLGKGKRKAVDELEEAFRTKKKLEREEAKFKAAAEKLKRWEAEMNRRKEEHSAKIRDVLSKKREEDILNFFVPKSQDEDEGDGD